MGTIGGNIYKLLPSSHNKVATGIDASIFLLI